MQLYNAVVVPDLPVPLIVPKRASVFIGRALATQDPATYTRGRVLAIQYETHNSTRPFDDWRFIVVVHPWRPAQSPYTRGPHFFAYEFESSQRTTRSAVYITPTDDRSKQFKVFYVHRVLAVKTATVHVLQ